MYRIAAKLDTLQTRPIVVVTHPRSGTHLTIDTMRRQFEQCRSWKRAFEPMNRLYVSLESLYWEKARGPMTEDQAVDVLTRVERPLIKTHMVPDELPVGDETGRGKLGRYWVGFIHDRCDRLYVHRDGRSMMCSFYLLEVGAGRSKAKNVSQFMHEQVRGLTRPARWAQHIRAWQSQDNVHTLRFEDLVHHTRETIGRLAGMFNLTPRYVEPLLPRRLSKALHVRARHRVLAGRPESSAILGRPTGLELPDWRRDFLADDRAFFHEQAGDMLIELGYEPSDDWVRQTPS